MGVRCRSEITREKFEELAAPILAKAMKPCEDALAKAGLTAGDIAAVEMVGAASRTPAIVKTVADVFKQEPKRYALAVSLSDVL
jgi:molecular chaperone DnaK (HSP70)